MKVDWKIYSAVAGIFILTALIFFLEKVFFFLLTIVATFTVALILGFFQPLKYLGIELVTLSTMFVGVVYGPVIGGIYGFVSLISHLIIGRYYTGTYLTWILPEYVAIGVLAGILKSAIIGPVGLFIIAGLNITNLVLTSLVESERVGKHFPYAIGNTIINSILFINFFENAINLV